MNRAANQPSARPASGAMAVSLNVTTTEFLSRVLPMSGKRCIAIDASGGFRQWFWDTNAETPLGANIVPIGRAPAK